jgi:hypothetical protein
MLAVVAARYNPAEQAEQAVAEVVVAEVALKLIIADKTELREQAVAAVLADMADQLHTIARLVQEPVVAEAAVLL